MQRPRPLLYQTISDDKQPDILLLKNILKALNIYIKTYFNELAADGVRRKEIEIIAQAIYTYLERHEYSVIARVHMQHFKGKVRLPIPSEQHVNIANADKNIDGLLQLITEKIDHLLLIKQAVSEQAEKMGYIPKLNYVADLITNQEDKQIILLFDRFLNSSNLASVKEAVHCRYQEAVSERLNQSINTSANHPSSFLFRKTRVSYVLTAAPSRDGAYDPLHFLNITCRYLGVFPKGCVFSSLVAARQAIEVNKKITFNPVFYILEVNLPNEFLIRLREKIIQGDKDAFYTLMSHVKAIHPDGAMKDAKTVSVDFRGDKTEFELPLQHFTAVKPEGLERKGNKARL